jgi:hypothetical protein
MYAQQLEGDSWKDSKLDKGKIDKMSGTYITCVVMILSEIGTRH